MSILMKKNKIVLFFCSFMALFFLSGCEVISDYFLVISGNYSYERGFYQRANYSYLKVLDNEKYQNYVAYNLGNVYHDLGAMDSALEQWSKVDSSADQELRFRVAFNRGVLYYGSGEYKLAFGEFRKAIQIKPVQNKKRNLVAARQNLELCLQKLNMRAAGVTERNTASRKNSSYKLDAKGQAMMDLIKKRAEINWKQYDSGNPVSVEDY